MPAPWCSWRSWRFKIAAYAASAFPGLTLPEGGVFAALFEEFGVGSAFGDTAAAQDEDLVGVDDGGEAVGDHQRRAAGLHAAQGLLDRRLGRAVERAGRLVEDQHAG